MTDIQNPQSMSPARQRFNHMALEIANEINQHSLNMQLISHLNERFGHTGYLQALQAVVLQGELEGWCLQHEEAGIKFSRPIKANTEADIYSVDVVEMQNISGPFHAHPNGEIGVVLPISGAPKFDEFAQPWYVYEAETKHYPTISDGHAHVLYWLPHGKIDFKAPE